MKRNFSIFTSLMGALTLGLATFIAPSFTTNYASAAPVQTAGRAPAAEPESAALARREVARVPTARIARIKEPKVREAAQRLLSSMQAVANNQTAAREAALIEAAERNHAALKLTLGQTPAEGCISDGVSQYQSCKTSCKNSGKKFCGCLIIAAADTLICIGGKLIPG